MKVKMDYLKFGRINWVDAIQIWPHWAKSTSDKIWHYSTKSAATKIWLHSA